ncbi:hypothetical protein [Microbacterium mangrovi]|uniref:hypothetical protein n=1 Tax=Microbacterium mangrovi TaxID=1348253 RepID=UPI000689F6CA|nr:hypothetical protein [Microbacterium mangrovi]
MKPRTTRLRATCLAASAAAVVALVAAPAAQAAPADGKPHGPKFSATQLNKASKTVTPRIDGTPGQVADAQGDSAPSVSLQGVGAAPKSSPSANDENVKGFVSKGSIETMQGATETMALAGTGDWIAMTSAGNVARYDKNGDAVWSIGAHDLDAAWQATYDLPYTGNDFTPALYEGFNPYQMSSTGTHPYAQLDVNHDGTPDVAVAYNLGSSTDIPFHVPDSDLSTGTFINVLDGKTGRMLWHTLVPGTVGSLLAQDGQLIAAETTGPNWDLDPVTHQGNSRSSLLSYTFSGSGGAVTGRQKWVYDTHVPDADWSDLTSMGAGRLTVGWSDTPMGLGDPRPAAGHVLVVDTSTGKADLDVKTPGYPRIVQPDAAGTGVLVAEQNDPLSAVYWQLTDIDAKTGSRSVIATRDSAIPTSLQVNRDARNGRPAYIASELGINADLTDGASRVFGLDAAGGQEWSYATASATGADETSVLDVALDPRGQGQVLVTTADGVAPSKTRPEGPYQTQFLALGATDGRVKWQRNGAVASDTITPYDGGYLTVGYSLTAFQTNIQGKTTAQQPLLSDQYATDAVDVNGDGTLDIVSGGMSHGVFAIDGKALAAGRTVVLWKAPVDSSVHDVTVAPVLDATGVKHTRVVAATSNGFAVIDPATGKVVSDVDTGAFQYKVVVSNGRILASSKTAFGSYDETGRTAWTYRPAGAGSAQVAYSTPAVDANGHVFLETGGVRSALRTGASSPVPTAVGLDAATGKHLWSVDITTQTSADQAAWIEQQSGVYASSDIPGAGGDGVAFGFGGDKPGSSHTVMIVRGSTGDVLKTMDSDGAQTFSGYASSPDQGLFWLHWFEISKIQGASATQQDQQTMATNSQGVFGFAQDGTEMFFGTDSGVLSYALPLTSPADDAYAYSAGSAFAYDAGHITPAPLYPGKTTTLVAVQKDYAAYNQNELTSGGFDVDSRATDPFPHGITVLQATGAKPATGADAAAPAPAASAVAKAMTPTALKQNFMPIGVASAPHVIQSKSVATRAGFGPPAGPRGYTPQQIQKRLGLTGDGTGQTVAISIAYDYPNAASDVDAFSTQFGLPLTCGSTGADAADCFDFRTVYAEGTKPAQNDGWNEEAALDIETIHSIVPKAKVVLVEAKDASAAGLYQAVDVAASLHPDAVNNSWGMGEFSEESFYDQHCKLSDTLCTQSTGDDGWPSGYSSTNPYALAVGGTRMTLAADGSTSSEVAWANGGGGFSFFEKQPAYQHGVVTSDHRATPDVSFNADPATGVAVYVTVADGTHYWMQVGGTSLSSPSWAAIVTAADQLREANGKAKLASDAADGDTMHKAIYSLGSALSDITAGTNGLCEQECTAGPGFDTVTGLGSPLAGIDQALAAK